MLIFLFYETECETSKYDTDDEHQSPVNTNNTRGLRMRYQLRGPTLFLYA